jgi:hypothetical protein
VARLLRERRNAFWTATSWTSEGAMKKFMISGSHGKAMRKLAEWCDDAAVAHWNQESSELPTWLEAYARLRTGKHRDSRVGSRTIHGPHSKS